MAQRKYALVNKLRYITVGDDNLDFTTGVSLTQGDNYLTLSDGTTGGTGSAGAGNQYVELVINGTTYKVLHDGTV